MQHVGISPLDIGNHSWFPPCSLVLICSPSLLAKVKELGGMSKFELVRECGYLSAKRDGSERLNYITFYEALSMKSCWKPSVGALEKVPARVAASGGTTRSS
jgi:hypothetical protein